jgi:hypothetical protein
MIARNGLGIAVTVTAISRFMRTLSMHGGSDLSGDTKHNNDARWDVCQARPIRELQYQ